MVFCPFLAIISLLWSWHSFDCVTHSPPLHRFYLWRLLWSPALLSRAIRVVGAPSLFSPPVAPLYYLVHAMNFISLRRTCIFYFRYSLPLHWALPRQCPRPLFAFLWDRFFVRLFWHGSQWCSTYMDAGSWQLESFLAGLAIPRCGHFERSRCATIFPLGNSYLASTRGAALFLRPPQCAVRCL